MTDRKLFVIALVTTALGVGVVIGLFFIGLAIANGNYQLATHATLNACDTARIYPTAMNVSECQQMQVNTHTEYVCGQYNCWLEVK